MPSMETVAAGAAVHMLLIGDSKTGKSTYAGDAAVDGFELIYIDADNGLSAMVNRISKEPNAIEIMKRVNYFAPSKPLDFLMSFLKSDAKRPLVWLAEENKEAPRLTASLAPLVEENPDSPVWVIDATAIPKSTLLVIDSWTSLASDALGLLRAEQSSGLLDNEGAADQSLYGSARIKLVHITNMLQRIECHVLVQAHGTIYERFEKPKGATGMTKQKDMKLIETIDVPVSSSRVHGLEMASRFNHIGRLLITPTGQTEIDFKRHPNKVGGGPPNRSGKTTDLSFKQLVGDFKLDTPKRPWYTELTLSEYKAAIDAASTRK